MLNAQVTRGAGRLLAHEGAPGSPDKIDAAVAAVLAYEARADAIAGVEEEPSRELLAF